MTEEEAKKLMQTHTAICDFKFYQLHFHEDDEYLSHWLWHDQSGDIWFDYYDVLEIEAFMNISPQRITDTRYIRKWLRLFLKKRPSFQYDLLKEELYMEIEDLMSNMFSMWFHYNPEGGNWGVCIPELHQPIHPYVDMCKLQNDFNLFCQHFNLDVWKKVIMEYEVPKITMEQVREYQHTIQVQKERILALESELNALKGMCKIENNIQQLNMGNGTQIKGLPSNNDSL